MAKEQVLYRKWRPQKFADFVGQNHVKQTIVNSIKADKVSHAYLFAGPRGTGKTSMARLLAKAVNCLNIKSDGEPCGECKNCQAALSGIMIDLIEIDAASHTGVDDVRDLIEKVNLAPSVGKYKVYIVDEVHMLSKNAFNALLKTLEEPPGHVIFILATTEVHKLLPTVVSRCQYFDFHHLSWDEIINQLKKVVSSEKISITDDAVSLIAQNSEGSLRDSLSILDQVVSLGVSEIDKQTLEKILGITDNTVVQELTQAILNKDTLVGIDIINNIYFKGYDINQLTKNWIGYLRELLMIRLGNEELVSRSADEKKIMGDQSQQLSPNELINLLQRLIEAHNNYRVASIPQLALEMMMIRATENHNADLSPGKTDNIKNLAGKTANPKSEPAPQTKPKIQKPESIKSKPDSNFWPGLCQKVSITNPALSALMKNSQVDLQGDKLIITAPSEFLKDVINKASNLLLISSTANELGIKNATVECVVSQTVNKEKNQVAEVFDII